MCNSSSKTIILVWFNLLLVILTNSFLAFWYQSLYIKRYNEYCKIFWQEFQKERPQWQFKSRGRQKKKKKIRDGSSASTTDNCGVFEEGLESPECKEILFNCLRNLQEKVTEIFNLAQDTRNMQIKGDKQLEELKSSVEVMSDKFDEYEKDWKDKEKIKNGLQNGFSSLKERIDSLE